MHHLQLHHSEVDMNDIPILPNNSIHPPLSSQPSPARGLKMTGRPTPASDETERIADEIGEHWIKHDVNLGQYKSELQCACGDKLIVDGHADDWHSSHTVTVNRHIASKIAAAVQAESRKLLEKALEGRKSIPVHGGTDSYYPSKYIEAVPVSVITALLDSEQQKLGGSDDISE